MYIMYYYQHYYPVPHRLTLERCIKCFFLEILENIQKKDEDLELKCILVQNLKKSKVMHLGLL